MPKTGKRVQHGEEEEEGSRVKYGKVWGTGRRVKKSQQESSVNDRRNLISKIHKSSAEVSSTMHTKEPSVQVNTDLLLEKEWIDPSC